MENLKEVRARRDTYHVIGNAFVKKAIEIEGLTGCLGKLKGESDLEKHQQYQTRRFYAIKIFARYVRIRHESEAEIEKDSP